MNICILAPRYPFPENGGDVLRINQVARYLKGRGHRLTLVAFRQTDLTVPDIEHLYDEIVTVHRNRWFAAFHILTGLLRGRPMQRGYYMSREYGRAFRQVIANRHFDLYISHLVRMIPYLEENGLCDRSIVEMTDALSKTYELAIRAKGGGMLKYIYMVERGLIKHYEQYVIGRFPKVVLVSADDIERLNEGHDHANLCLYPNGVDINPQPSTTYESNKITFIGNMRTLQNSDAVVHFARNIFPLILRERPDAVFQIVGNQPSPAVRALACDNIVVTGFVENLNAVIADSCVVVAPVRVAAGIQNKVLVAMANRLPIVLTPLISRAIPELHDGTNCFICDADRDFADACLRLMSDAQLRDRLAANGYEMVRQHYSWNAKLSGYENL